MRSETFNLTNKSTITLNLFSYYDKNIYRILLESCLTKFDVCLSKQINCNKVPWWHLLSKNISPKTINKLSR